MKGFIRILDKKERIGKHTLQTYLVIMPDFLLPEKYCYFENITLFLYSVWSMCFLVMCAAGDLAVPGAVTYAILAFCICRMAHIEEQVEAYMIHKILIRRKECPL